MPDAFLLYLADLSTAGRIAERWAPVLGLDVHTFGVLSCGVLASHPGTQRRESAHA